MHAKARLTKLLSTAAWVLGATSVATVIHPAPAEAVLAATCNNNVTSQGGGSTSTATFVGAICDATTFTVNQLTLPAYWEFTWLDQNPNTVHSTITSGTRGGSFFGTLDLYNSAGTPLQSGSYSQTSLADSFTGTTEATINDVSFNPAPNEYILGINATFSGLVASLADPPITVSFAAAVPEPASLGIIGGALAVLGLFRRKRQPKT